MQAIKKIVKVPCGLKRFIIGEKGKTILNIKKTSKLIEIDSETDGSFCLTGFQQEHIQKAEDMINNIIKNLICLEIPEAKEVIPKIIGKHGKIINGIEEKSQTEIKVDEPLIYIHGAKEQQHKAKIAIKEIVSNHLKTKTFSDYKTKTLIDDSYVGDENDEFCLKYEDNSHARWVGRYHKIVGAAKEDPLKENDIEGVEKLCEEVQKILQELEQREDRDSFYVIFWCHYGNVYLKDVDEEDEKTKYSAQDIKKNILTETNSGWKSTFKGGLEQLEVHELKEEFDSSKEAVRPYTKYDFTILSPSCRHIRLTMFLREENGRLSFSRLDPAAGLPHVPEIPDRPIYKLEVPSVQHLKVHIIILNTEIDCCLTIQTKSKQNSYTPEEEAELEELKKILNGRLWLNDNRLELIKQDELPEGFDLTYWRKSKRGIFKDDGFTITVSEEEYENVNGFELGNNVLKKNDVQIHLNNSDKKLYNQECQTDQTKKYVQKVISFAREVQTFLST